MEIACRYQDSAALSEVSEVGTRCQTDFAGEISSCHISGKGRFAMLGGGQAVEVVEIFITEPSASQGDQAVVGMFELFRSKIQSLIPGNWYMLALLAQQWLVQAGGAGFVVVGKPAFITNPDFVDTFILAWHHAFNHNFTANCCLSAHIERQIAAHRAMSADRSHRFQLPGAGFEMEINGGQGTNRADIGGVA